MKKISFLLFFAVFQINTLFVFAQGVQENPDGGGAQENPTRKLENVLNVDTIQELLAVILSAVVQIAIPFLVLAVMYVGFLFVAARGNPEKLSKAKQALFFTLLGALIILGAQTLSIVLSGTIQQLTEGVGN